MSGVSRWPPAMGRTHRVAALGAVIGPTVFIVTWVIAGQRTPGYEPVDDAISQLAAVGASTRLAMTLGFLVLGLGLIVAAAPLREAIPGPTWLSVLVCGGATLAVAALPLGGPVGDQAHGVAATIAYLGLVGIPTLAGLRWRAEGHLRRAWTAWIIAAAGATSLALSTVDPVNGLFQRVGLTVIDGWLIVTAGTIAVRGPVFVLRSAARATRRPR